MAEARSVATLGGEFTAGTRVGLSVDDDGLHLRTDITIPPPREAVRRMGLQLKSIYRLIYYSFFPFGPAVVLTITAIVVTIVVNSPRESWWRSGSVANVVWDISQHFWWVHGLPLSVRVGILAAWTAVVAVFAMAIAQRLLLRLALMDKTFLYQAREPTLYVKAWFMLVRALTFRPPLLYGFQSALPRMPVPRLQPTVDKYLESAKLLQTPEEFEVTKQQAADFLANAGPKLQFYLNVKSWMSANYVTDWWEKYVYLRGRSSIAVNSNYYVLDSGRWTPTTVQEARCATVLYQIMRYKEALESESIRPLMAGDGAVPLCMWQCSRMFSTSRIPGRECDEIKHWDPAYSKHVAVYCKGSYYKLQVYRRDGLLRTPDELETALRSIKEDASGRQPREAEACISALTAENRTRWAEIREREFGEGLNRRSLHAIESALVSVVLSDETFDTLDWTSRGMSLLAGSRERPNVWFDKSLNYIVFADGKSGLNCEHAWADAPVCAHLFEVAMIYGEEKLSPYTPEGHCRGFEPPSGCGKQRTSSEETWTRLSWNLSRDAEDAIAAAVSHIRGLIDDLDLQVVAHSAYGKDFVKKCKVSPDAYVQMAMQLAYYRDQGHFDATYESSMTRLFLHGRTETVRPVTAESCKFVHAMNDPKASPLDKLLALQAAAKRHVRGYTDAMAGKGIDRHLFALYVVSVGKGVDSPFLKGALSMPWKLSTSQQPQQQTTLWDIKDPKNAKKISPGGGFGPVHDDGYGVSYMVSGERELFFHVSSKKSSPLTDSKRFVQLLFGALTEMKDVLALAITDDTTKTVRRVASPITQGASASPISTTTKNADPSVTSADSKK